MEVVESGLRKHATRWGTHELLAILCIAVGCQGISIKRIGGSPSLSSAGRLERIGRWADPGPVERTIPPAIRGSASLDSGILNRSDPAFLLARADASYRAGLNARRESKEGDARYQVDPIADTSAAIEGLLSEPQSRRADLRIPGAYALHGAAQEEFLRVTSGRSIRLDEAWRSGLLEKGIRLTIARDSEFLSPESFDRFFFVDVFAIKNLDRKYTSTGVGVPLIALKKFDLKQLEGQTGEEKFLMPRQVYPMTAVVKLNPPATGDDAGPYGLRLELHDPLVEKRVEFGGAAVPLATDLPTPLVYHFHAEPAVHPPGDGAARSAVAGEDRRAVHAPPLRAGQDPRGPRPRPPLQPGRMDEGDQ